MNVVQKTIKAGMPGKERTLVITPRAQYLCLFLANLAHGSHLRNVSGMSLLSILAFLEGDDHLAFLRTESSAFQFALVSVWMLAGQLGLPELQNCMVHKVRVLYLDARERGISIDVCPYAVSHARRHPGCKKIYDLLIAFVGGLIAHDHIALTGRVVSITVADLLPVTKYVRDLRELKVRDALECDIDPYLVEIPPHGHPGMPELYERIEVEAPAAGGNHPLNGGQPGTANGAGVPHGPNGDVTITMTTNQLYQMFAAAGNGANFAAAARGMGDQQAQQQAQHPQQHPHQQAQRPNPMAANPAAGMGQPRAHQAFANDQDGFMDPPPPPYQAYAATPGAAPRNPHRPPQMPPYPGHARPMYPFGPPLNPGPNYGRGRNDRPGRGDYGGMGYQ